MMAGVADLEVAVAMEADNKGELMTLFVMTTQKSLNSK